jgi:hypothetical protein
MQFGKERDAGGEMYDQRSQMGSQSSRISDSACRIRSLRLQHFDEGFPRDVDFADAFHPLFSFFLFLQQFALASDVAAVAVGPIGWFSFTACWREERLGRLHRRSHIARRYRHR